MKCVWLSVLLAACAGASTETAPTRAMVAPCAACSPAGPISAPMATCPQVPCAAPLVAPQTAQDWYCLDLLESDGTREGMCWVSLDVCQQKREKATARKLGKTTPCVAQRIAHCVGITYPQTFSWVAYCARTPENCERNREVLLEELPDDRPRIRPCQRTLNIDPHESMRAPPPSP